MYRLIYRSQSSREIDWEMMGNILHVAENNNSALDVSGVLLASRQQFLQVIEGEYDTVNKLFFQIATDKRHKDIQLISFGCVANRLFSGWGMRGIGTMDFNAMLEKTLKEKYGSSGSELQFPTEEWAALAMINDIRQMHGLPEWQATYGR